MVRYAVLALLLTLSACGSGFGNRSTTLPGNDRRPEAMPSNAEPAEFHGMPP
jgi:hypothetical protein